MLGELLGAHETALTFTKGGEVKVVCHCGVVAPAGLDESWLGPSTAASGTTIAAESEARPTLLTVRTATSSATQEGVLDNCSGWYPRAGESSPGRGQSRTVELGLEKSQFGGGTVFGAVRPARTSQTPWQAKRAMRVRVSMVALPM